ncbi:MULTISPECIES: hypothetical protein [unclassified Butyrivibrio]|uniref:hypothetical protein n=1 Tax=unclassified Butyrivibrio TaxID=2639466 RepID=UPI0003B60799|nr:MULTISPECIES: hypothetical protein [unclassified Butyrivibrio]SDB08080.1 hypothetical protein SAMN02910263_00357 [Butyrivibrio sp. INlla16]
MLQNKNQKNRIRNLIVAYFAFAMLFVVLFSAVFVSVETFHNCDGDSCPVCALLQQCENNLNQLGDGSANLYAAFLAVILFVAILELKDNVLVYSTPVSSMVRMND